MRKIRLPRLSLIALALLGAHAHAQSGGLGLKLDRSLVSPSVSANERLPVFVEADDIQGHQDRDLEARGNARLRSRGKALAADWLYYQSELDEVDAAGNVRLEQRGDVFEGTRLKLNLETDHGFMQQPRYRLGELNARGDAREFFFVGENRYRVDRGNYTTCGPGQDDWFIRARDLDIDKNTEVGTARDASVVFKGAPLLYLPWVDFSLSQKRKSGFLSPTFATSGKSGAEFSLPYYWNIAPNRDATFTPHALARRGVMLGTEFRYLERAYRGELRFETLPNDRVANADSRYATSFRHQQTWGPWALLVNLQKASDNNYFRDLSNNVQATSLTFLPRELTIARGGTLGSNGNWGFTGQTQRFQTLQDPLAPITPPYFRLPQLSLVTNTYDVLHTDINFTGSYVDFHHPTLLTGRRLVAYPSVSLPLSTPFAFLTPKVGVHHTRYMLDSNAAGLRDANRTVPIFSTEGGLVFERDTAIRGRSFLQTLEPKLQYLYIPTRAQNALPNFESAVADVNFATIFAENQFAGNDRINDANQVTLGVNSRLLDPQTGIEQLRVGLAQRYYFRDQSVTIPGVAPRTGTSSDVLAALAGRVAPNWIAEAAIQYDNDASETRKFTLAARYQPDFGKVFNASYRFTRNVLENVDVSTQWPIATGWSTVARMNYSLRDRRIAEGLAGFEYNGGCWVVRFVSYTVAVGTGNAARSVFLQLELNGVAKVGSNPLDVLRQNIAGYTKVNEPQGSTLPPLR
jgi:LPS-assembly protein